MTKKLKQMYESCWLSKTKDLKTERGKMIFKIKYIDFNNSGR